MIAWFRHSLAGQLYGRVLGLTATIGIAMALLLFAIVRTDIDRRADEQLVTSAHVLFLLMREEFDGDATYPAWYRDRPTERLLSDEDIAAFQASASWRQFAVFHNGVMTVRPRSASAAARFPSDSGFHEFTVQNRRWRSYGLAIPEHKLTIVIAERDSVRQALILQGAERLIVPMVLLILGAAVLLWHMLRRGLSDVDRLRVTLASRSPQDLHPLEAGDWPDDLQDLILAVNRLFGRVRNAFEHEQTLTDQAAHQLRTPLAALRVQTQLLARDLPPTHRDDADALLASVDRASEIVSQMLQLARLDATELVSSEVDLVALATHLITDRALIAARAGAEFSLLHAGPVSALTDAGCLSVGLAALIDNAIAHAASGGLIEIEVLRSAEGCVIAVMDRGPGLTQSRRRELAASMPAAGDATRGLGLSIARRALQILGAQLWLDDRDGPGLTARILLPDQDRRP